MGKVNLRILQEDIPEEDLGIKSMMPQDLPKPEIKKRKAIVAQGDSDAKFSSQGTIDAIDHSMGDADLKSHIVDEDYFNL